MHRAMFVPALSLAMLATSAATQPAITRPDGRKLTPAQIDSTVNRLIQAAHVTGAGVALFHRGKIVYLNAYGLRDTEKGLPLTPDSVTGRDDKVVERCKAVHRPEKPQVAACLAVVYCSRRTPAGSICRARRTGLTMETSPVRSMVNATPHRTMGSRAEAW